MPRHHARVQRFDARLDCVRAPVAGQALDALQRNRVDRRLDQAAGGHVARGGGARSGAGPPIGARKVVARLGIEDDVWHASVGPLRIEERLELAQGSVQVNIREADRDEGAVPAPLVWVQSRRWLGPAAKIICGEHRQCCPPQVVS